MQILSIQGLTKRYGSIVAVDHLDLEIEEGQVFGILGPNGSGKTTTLGIILNVLKCNSGSFSWFQNSYNHDYRKKIGAILEIPAFYPYLSAVDNLRITAQIKGKGTDRIHEVLKQVKLHERQKDPYRTFSLGMKQRLAVAAAMLTDPPVLILDEPTNGLDPQGIAEMRQIITRMASEGKTIILASHILDEVQKVCTHFAVLNRGKKIYSGSVGETLSKLQFIELAAEDMDGLFDIMGAYPGIKDITRTKNKLTVTLLKEPNTAAINKYMYEEGIVLSHLALVQSTLEKQFLEILNQADD